MLRPTKQTWNVKLGFISFTTENYNIVTLALIIGVICSILYYLLVIIGFFAMYYAFFFAIIPNIYGWLGIIILVRELLIIQANINTV